MNPVVDLTQGPARSKGATEQFRISLAVLLKVFDEEAAALVDLLSAYAKGNGLIAHSQTARGSPIAVYSTFGTPPAPLIHPLIYEISSTKSLDREEANVHGGWEIGC
ncbi:hypothetical protein BKA70DRAFT_1218604 [Coprinopsis sp. MPI-PUGE-AT-0042]|nr:hypothetical protein BKA70DRAFT_1218604 [Coprinopsis sp. MPI-PUGE-AT-0042]